VRSLRIVQFLRLFRLDVALIAFISYLVGVLTVRGLEWRDGLIAGTVSMVSTNFIYVINAWSDREADRINSPGRPIPCGLVQPREALVYAAGLLFGSLVYPFVIARDPLTLALFLLLPVLGVAYSLPPLHLRRFALPSAFVVSLGLVTPVQLGYYMNCRDYRLVPIFVVGFLFCLSVVPLKDIADATGDRRSGYQNFYLRCGWRLPWLSVAGLVVSLGALFCQPVRGPVFVYILVAALSACAVIIALRKRPERIYKTVIWTAIAEAGLLMAVMRLGG